MVLTGAKIDKEVVSVPVRGMRDLYAGATLLYVIILLFPSPSGE